MSATVKRLLRNQWPLLPGLVSLALVMSPVYLFYLPTWGNTNLLPKGALWNLISTMHFLPAIAYFLAVGRSTRRKVPAWWWLPVPPANIGVALWWLMIGIPAITLLLGMAANASIVEPLIHNTGYLEVASEQYAALAIIVVNWGAWTVLRYGRFRYRSAGRLIGENKQHVRMLWPIAFTCLLCLAFLELISLEPPGDGSARPIPLAIGVVALFFTAGLLYVVPTLPFRFNALREERATSRTSRYLGGSLLLVVNVVYLCAALVAMTGAGFGLYHVVAPIWASKASVTSFLDLLTKTGGAAYHVALICFYGVMAWVAFTMLRMRSVSQVSPELDKLFGEWPRRGWIGLFNIVPLAFWLISLLCLILNMHFDSAILGVIGACFSAVCVVAGIHCDKRVFASLPVDPGRLTAGLHITVLAITIVPLALVLMISRGAWIALPVAAPLWLLGAAFGQLWLPFRMSDRAPPLLIRWGLYGIALIWAVLAALEIWPTSLGVVKSALTGFALRDGLEATNGHWRGDLLTAQGWAFPFSVGLFVIISLVATHRTYLNLTRDSGVRSTRPADTWRGQAA